LRRIGVFVQAGTEQDFVEHVVSIAKSGLAGGARPSSQDGTDYCVGCSARMELAPPRKALFGPVLFPVVILGHRRHSLRKDHPRLLRLREYVNVRWQMIRLVQRSDANEAYQRARARIVAPERNPALRTTRDELAPAACRRRINPLRLARKSRDPVRFDNRVQREGRAGLTLAPPTVAAMDKQWRCLHPVANVPAVAATIERERICRSHFVLLLFEGARIPTLGLQTVTGAPTL